MFFLGMKVFDFHWICRRNHENVNCMLVNLHAKLLFHRKDISFSTAYENWNKFVRYVSANERDACGICGRTVVVQIGLHLRAHTSSLRSLFPFITNANLPSHLLFRRKGKSKTWKQTKCFIWSYTCLWFFFRF